MTAKNLLFSAAILGVTLPSTLQADTTSSTSQRADYQAAVSAFERGERDRADSLTAALSSYALHPYLQARQLKRDIKSVTQKQIEDFRQRYAGTPIVRSVQASYLSYLTNTKQWQALHDNYLALPLTSAAYKCRMLQAQIALGQSASVSDQISTLWNVGSSQPKVCNSVFQHWIKQGNPSSDLAFERTWKAINNKNFKLAKYSEKFVKKQAQKASLATFWQVKKDIATISDKNTVGPKTLHGADIAAYAIRQLAIKQPDPAIKAWFRDRQRLQFSAQQREYLNTYFSNKYAKKSSFDPKAPGILQRLDPNFKYDEISEWKARLALIQQDWRKVAQTIEAMPTALRQDTKWQYWHRTATHKLKPNQQPNFSDIAAQRSFYSYAAAQLTRTPLQLQRKELAADPQVLKELQSIDTIARMAELVKLGDTVNAHREWRSIRDALTDNQKIAMAHLAHQWGWYIQGIRIAAKLKEWDLLKVRFPRSQIALFEELGKLRGIGNTWPVAIARQESAYNQFARSPAGARGFMQLMPATAAITAKKFNIEYKGKSDLYDPRTNISLGTAYLAQMYEKFGNKAYATAAYNAGPHRVERWHKARGHLPLDIWIETIPFNETRHYVQNVLTYSAIYDLLAGRQAAMFNNAEKLRLAVNTR
ncbi:MAG: transglycosylase SLT domain-containing protein [Pseudomonadales bacterium]